MVHSFDPTWAHAQAQAQQHTLARTKFKCSTGADVARDKVPPAPPTPPPKKKVKKRTSKCRNITWAWLDSAVTRLNWMRDEMTQHQRRGFFVMMTITWRLRGVSLWLQTQL